MNNNEYNGSTEYEKATSFLEIGCNCGCSKIIPREKFAELREAFQALSRFEQDTVVAEINENFMQSLYLILTRSLLYLLWQSHI